MKIILNSYAKIHRNLKNYKFPNLLKKESEIILKEIKNNIFLENHKFINNMNLSENEKLDFLLNDTCSFKFINKENRGIFLNNINDLVLLNDTDHLVIQEKTNDLEIFDIYNKALTIENEIYNKLDFAFNNKFGYLTSNPKFCGLGLEIGVVFHLPATIYFEMDKLNQLIDESNLNIFKISKNIININLIIKPNQNIDLIIEDLIKLSKDIIDIERINRNKNSIDLEDLIFRSLGILKYTRKINEEETFKYLSYLSLGVDLKILKSKIDIDLIDIFNMFKNDYLKIENKELRNNKIIDIFRANRLRKLIKEVF